MNEKSFTAVKKEYLSAGVSAIVIATNYCPYKVANVRDSYIVFYKLPIRSMTADIFYTLFSKNNHDDYDFRIITKGYDKKHRNVQIIEELTAFDMVKYSDLEKYDGSNFGYKCESYLFGKCNYNHDDLVDGYLNGKGVQVKSSINHGNGYASSNKF